MKIINFYINPEWRGASRSYAPMLFTLGVLSVVLAGITGYLMLDYYKYTRIYQATLKKMAPKLERQSRTQQLQEQYNHIIATTPSAINPFGIITPLKSWGMYVHTASVRNGQAIIEMYHPTNGNIQQLITKLAKEFLVKKVELIAIKQHTKDQRVLRLAVTYA